MVDVGKIVREATTAYLAPPAPNRATPARLKILVKSLRKTTDQVYAEFIVKKATNLNFWISNSSSFDQFKADMDAWQGRLQGYEAALSAAPASDRKAILWTVTAPLLLGFYGGADSKAPQAVPDVATPYILMNGFGTMQTFADENYDRLMADMKDAAVAIAKKITTHTMNIGAGVGIALAGYGVYLLASKRKR